MKKWMSLGGISAIMVVLVFCSNKPFSAEEPLLNSLLNALNSQHYAPKELNDSFSLLAYENVFENIDGDKQFFTEQDMKRFSKYKTSIDDQINNGRFDFFDTVWTVMMRRLDVIEPLVKNELENPLDYSKSVTYEVKDEPTKYAKDLEDLKCNWKNWARYQTVDRLYRKMEQQKKIKSSETDSVKVEPKPYDTLELKSRIETKKFIGDWFKRWRKMDRKEQLTFYANTIAEIYDPHTNYFPPEDKANFDISMTGKLEGIGATLSERDGYVKVESIVPGSASYKQGELKAGDMILKVAQGNNDFVDIVDMKLDDAIQLIRGKKGTTVRLTVKKPDGSIKIIPIVREQVVIEESYARSALIKIKGLTFGVIQLPSFYADFSARGRGRNCSRDVSIEIEKLREAEVNGIILDLRNNGGGSLADAIDMSGLFIKSGPIVQVKRPKGQIDEANDPDPNVQYNGPLVILTNNYSASASEILAAALQDYQRAVIVGTKSTFGKGTVQTMIPLEGGKSDVFKSGLGELKITIQKFYRINGGTTQLMGVIPDVVVPDIYDGIKRGEKEMDYHLPFDQIKPARYTKQRIKGYDSAIQYGRISVKNEPYFEMVAKRSKQIAAVRKSVKYNLKLSEYEKQMEAFNKMDKEFKDFSYKARIDSVFALPMDLMLVKDDAVKTTQKTTWLKRYAKDAELDIAAEVLYEWSRKP